MGKMEKTYKLAVTLDPVEVESAQGDNRCCRRQYQ